MTRITPLLFALGLLPLSAHAAPVPLTLPSAAPTPGAFDAHIRAAASAVRAHLPQIAATNYQAALRLHPADADAHYALGGVWELLKRPADAEREYRRTIQIDPAHAAAHNALAGLLDDRGLLDAALAQSQQALVLEPGSAPLHCNQADLLAEAKRYPEARREYEVALRLHPGLMQARQGLAALPAMSVIPSPMSKPAKVSKANAHRRENGPEAGFILKP